MTTSEIFFELLRAGIWGRNAQIGNIRPDDAQWAEIVHTARKQSVTGTVFDGVITLPPEQMPPRKLKLQMAADVTFIEQRNAQMRKVLRGAAETLDANACPYVLLKGMAVGELYPTPQHRTSGDIDLFFTPDDCAKATVLLFRGTSVSKSDRHTSGIIKGVHIENHFELAHSPLKLYKAFSQEILTDNIRLPLSTITIDGYNVNCPSPTFHALFMLEHLASHFLNGVGLRQICDWAVLLRRYSESINREVVAHILRKYNFDRSANAFALICVDLLGLPEECVPQPLVRNKGAQRDLALVLDTVFEGGNFGQHYAPGNAIQSHQSLPAWRRKPMSFYFTLRKYRRYELISRKFFWGTLLNRVWRQIMLKPNGTTWIAGE